MNLNPEQQRAVDYGNGPLLIMAGAGSGKTKTLTSRLIKILAGGAFPESVLAITFTNKAAEEMRNRIISQLNPKPHTLYPFIGTFHSFGARLLRENAQTLGRTRGFTIFDSDDSDSLMKKIAKDLNLSKERYKLPVIESRISKVKSLLIDPETFLDSRELNFYQIYEEALKKNNAFDFDDLIEKVVWLFRENPSVLERYSDQFKYILVDEYQDVNPAQYQMVKLLAGKHKNLSVVGDDAQSIYKFRGSDFTNFLNFEEDWPNAQIVKLEQNYRSTANIITAASHLISHNKLQRKKNLWTENHEGELIKVISAENAYEEAEFIAKAIKKLTTNDLRLTTSILYRTNAQSRSIEQALISESIPYKIFGGVKFYQRKEIKDLVAALRVAANPRDEVSAERIIDTLPKALARELVAELKTVDEKLNILEIINFFITKGKYFEFLENKFQNAPERVENINEFIVFASEFKDLGEFLERVSLLQSTDTPNNSLLASGYSLTPVNLMSIHLAKGLEFDNVFIIGANEGLMPHQMSYGSMEELEEERRLMYVAMTRARHNLHISFYHLPSRFLYEIPPELTEFINLTGGKSELPDQEEMYIE